jgi:hypothetical protein
MTRLASLALASGLALAALGLGASPSSAQRFVFSDGGYPVPGGGTVHVGGQYGHGGGWGYGPRHGGGWGGPGYGHGWRGHHPGPVAGGGWGPRCRTVVVTRFSYRLGGYVQRPMQVCN